MSREERKRALLVHLCTKDRHRMRRAWAHARVANRAEDALWADLVRRHPIDHSA